MPRTAGKSKTTWKQYRRGQAPQYESEESSESDDFNTSHETLRKPNFRPEIVAKRSLPTPIPVKSPEVVQIQLLSESSDSESNDEISRDRDALRQRLLAQKSSIEPVDELQAPVAAPTVQPTIIADVEDEESEEYESESSEDTYYNNAKVSLKPVFVSKDQRRTIHEREKNERQAKLVEIAIAERVLERKDQAKAKVGNLLKREELEREERELMDSDVELPDDIDDDNDLEELESWKLRELERLKRERTKVIAEEMFIAERERRENMTDAEIVEENARLGIKQGRERSDIQFLQKYYHSGVFYQSEDFIANNLLERDVNVATGDDKGVDRSLLPSVMQVKNFGKKGQTKYTHLADQDTTEFGSNPWAESEKLRSKKARHK